MALDPLRDEARLPASLLVLITGGLGGLLIHAIPSVFIGLVSLIGGMYVYVWHILYGRMLSRHLRVVFDEVNVLNSYQPRARSMGHLFEPDLPTPAPSGGMEHNNNVKEDNFRKLRDAHYEGEYLKIMKLNKENDGLPLKAPTRTKSTSQQPFGDDLDDHTESGEI